MNMSNLAGLIDLEGRHDVTSVLTSLHVACDVACNPVAHALVIHICVLFDKDLVVVEVCVELILEFLTKADGANLDE